MALRMLLEAPLFTDWSEQYVRLRLAGVTAGTPLALAVNDQPAAFQYTGVDDPSGSEVMVRIGFAKGEKKALVFTPVAKGTTDLRSHELSLTEEVRVGAAGRELTLAVPTADGRVVTGPFAAFGGCPLPSRIHCESPFESASLQQVNDGPLFTDYRLCYRFADNRRYTVNLRCFHDRETPYIEVSEVFSLRMHAQLTWELNPTGLFDRILTHRGPEFEGEPQPVVQPLGQQRPGDLLCRLQMPVLSEYFVPNNRGWFAFFDSRELERGMVGVLGLHGAAWVEPVANIPEIVDRGSKVQWQASLASGARHWLLYHGPLETDFAADRRFVFHRLHAEFDQLRLDAHLDLTGNDIWDGDSWQRDGFFVGADLADQVRRRHAALKPLQRAVKPTSWDVQNAGGHRRCFEAIMEPTPERLEMVYEGLIERFEKWVRQFQGYRQGQHDYMKNVIGFSRWLRGMLIAYELLRKQEYLTPDRIGRLNAYFAFAARRIMDEGRWPHSRTALHPDHPQSVRDLYTYGGEHKPDRLYWTNSLPNFQSDPLCALAHLSALFAEHPDALCWQRLALADIEAQLSAYTGKSGAWAESINYALYTLSYMVITFRVLKRRLGIDYFNDDRVRRYVGWLCRFFGPRDLRFGAYTWPPVGNSVLPCQGGQYLMAYAAELAEDDPLRADCITVYQLQEDFLELGEHYPHVFAAMAPVPEERRPPRPLSSEVMDEVGVAMRHRHPADDQSYLFQKIGFAKDHYEQDETAFNWYAKGVPLCMDYGTYTGDVSMGAAHNIVEIPDMDSLRRGYLAHSLLTGLLDYTHCEVPVTLKLLWGYVRSFAEVDGKHAEVARNRTPYNYIGDKNPVGPKTWKTRKLLFIKPDYVVIFDQVFGEVPHRFNLHVTGEEWIRDGHTITARGHFGVDVQCYIQHPASFAFETGEFTPNYQRADDPEAGTKQRQSYFRLYNRDDGIYRTLLFARQPGSPARVEGIGGSGFKVTTDSYVDYVFVGNETVDEHGDGVAFQGRVAWVRRTVDGTVQACVPDGDRLTAFGKCFSGRGPWHYSLAGNGKFTLTGGPPRAITLTDVPELNGDQGRA